MEKFSQLVNINKCSSLQVYWRLLRTRIFANYAPITAVGIWILKRHYVNILIEDEIINLRHWGNTAMGSWFIWSWHVKRCICSFRHSLQRNVVLRCIVSSRVSWNLGLFLCLLWRFGLFFINKMPEILLIMFKIVNKFLIPLDIDLKFPIDAP